MKVYVKSLRKRKITNNSVPNIMAYGFIRNFLTNKQYEEMRSDYFIGELSPRQVNQAMKDIKWLFKTYKGLNAITIENEGEELTKFIL